MTQGSHDRLDKIFRPRSVAVAGVSSTATKLGNTVVDNIIGAGFAGPICAIGSAENVVGATCVATIADLPEAPDLLFLAVPAQACVAAAREAAARGVGAVIVGASGFAESGDEGRAMQDALADVAKQTGLLVVGPNCNGLYNPHERLAIGFNSGHARQWPAGGIALVSHSGALFDAVARCITRFGGGLAFFVSAGNEADLNVLDYLEHALEDTRTRVIALLIDAVPDAARLRSLAQRAATTGKAIVALKLGSSARGADAATAHSSRLAGDHVAHLALFAACGIHVAATLEGLAATAALLERFGRIEGALAAISTSGAGASLVADLCDAHDIPLAEYAPATVATLTGRRRFSALTNPTDIGFFGSLAGFDVIMRSITADPGVGAFLAFIHSIGPRYRMLSEAFRSSIVESGKPHIILAPGGLDAEERAAYQKAGALVLHESEPCFGALAALFTNDPTDEGEAIAAIQVLPPGLKPGPLDELASLSILQAAGARTIAVERCGTIAEAEAAAARLGYPVVLKGLVDGVAHKSDQGLVALNLGDAEALRRAYDQIGSAQVLVQPALRAEIEAIVGYSNDPGAGPLLLLGLGGIHTETLGQVTSVSLPATRSALATALDASIIGRVLAGPRWRHPLARADFLNILAAVQALAIGAAREIEAIDINPVLLGEHGAIAVDALIVIQR